MLILLLAACTKNPEPEIEPAGPRVFGDCMEEILIPAGGLAGDPIPAQAHELVYGAEPDPSLVRYQWPERDPSRSAAFLWKTGVDTLASQLEIGPAVDFPAGAERYSGASFLFGTGTIGEGKYRVHELRLCDRLEPATAYSYRVGGEGHWSETYTFSTPGAPGSFDTFRVGMAGDSRGAYETWAQVVTAMEEHAPDFYLFTGDMVELGTSQSEWEDWFAAGGDVFAQKALIAAHGNHEFLAQNYFAQFAFPGNEQWFAIEYGDAVFVSLNDTVSDSDHVELAQVDYVRAVMEQAQARWRVATHHHTMFSLGSAHGSDTDLREVWAPLFDEVGMDLVVAGHNHLYERSVPISGDAEVSPGEGTVYVVSGGAGAPLYGVDETQWFSQVANPVEHYMIADFGPEGIDVVVRDLQGQVIDSFHIER